MLFYPERDLVLVKQRTIKSEKNGKEYVFVTMADPDSFENQDFMLSKDQDPKNLAARNRYRVALEIDGKFMTATLMQPDSKKTA